MNTPLSEAEKSALLSLVEPATQISFRSSKTKLFLIEPCEDGFIVTIFNSVKKRKIATTEQELLRILRDNYCE